MHFVYRCGFLLWMGISKDSIQLIHPSIHQNSQFYRPLHLNCWTPHTPDHLYTPIGKAITMAVEFFKLLVASPEINPSNRKAKSIPVLNPFDQYGRIFFFSWLGFMVAFLSWYAFPPLVGLLKNCFNVKQEQRTDSLVLVVRDHRQRPRYDRRASRQLEHRCLASNVRYLVSSRKLMHHSNGHRFLVRFIAGPLCDRFGPRLVFVGLLLCGSIPTVLAGCVTSPNGLIALRFFIGILGGTFVPCQVWCTGFFDKKIVGTANSLAAGWGNAGGGIT